MYACVMRVVVVARFLSFSFCSLSVFLFSSFLYKEYGGNFLFCFSFLLSVFVISSPPRKKSEAFLKKSLRISWKKSKDPDASCLGGTFIKQHRCFAETTPFFCQNNGVVLAFLRRTNNHFPIHASGLSLAVSLRNWKWSTQLPCSSWATVPSTSRAFTFCPLRTMTEDRLQ